ncbi:MAG: 4-(cytidine 5'-diphospho)-2-C-methyl-D-erythritol kinase [Bacteroidales bacterium]|nr:4-(cytidine 5'-diphospho)-2-C-methyl-D-erythritol kinase [Bacteroidales bacterium]
MITDPNVKINLGLNILRKREDGYHDLETLFVPYFGISDRLEIVIGDDYSRTSAYLFNRYGTDGPESQIAVKPEGVFGTETEESGFDRLVQKMSEDGKVMITIARAEGVDWDPLKDLTVKAYRVLAEDFELPPVKIFLEKKSPVGAGLGGGSADAAFALKMINELCELGLSELSLATYASRLGSDCAFFIYNRPMFGEGRGEVLTEFTSDVIRFNAEGYAPAGLDIQVVSPEGISVSTKDAYGGIVPHIPEVPLREVLSGPVERWKELLVNDFEATVFAKHPELAAIKQSLYDSGAVYASMSGSGSSLFAVYEKEQAR